MQVMMINHNYTEIGHSEIVPWWSFGKTVLATAIYKLVEQNRLDLEASYFGLKGTLKQLLRHEAGLKDYYSSADYHNAVNRNQTPWSFEEMLTKMKADELLFEPGSGWMYSNIGYAYIRNLIEMVTNQSLEKALQSLVFDPIEIYHVKVAMEPNDLISCRNVAEKYHPGWLYHGLLIGTLEDAVQFLDALSEGKVISKETLREMCKPYKIDFDIGDRPWKIPGYASGIMTDGGAEDSIECFGHTGTGPGSTIAVYHFPERDRKITVAVSRAEKDQGIIEREVIHLANSGVIGIESKVSEDEKK